MSKIKNTLVGVVCAVATLLSSCDSHASCVEERNGIEIPNQKSISAAKKLKKEAEPLTTLFKEERDVKTILYVLSPLQLKQHQPIIDALEPLVAGFKKNRDNSTFTGFMIKDLGKINSDDIPGYMDVLKVLVPEPKDARSTHELLQVFLTQGSVSAAQELVNEAEPLTTLFTGEGNFTYIIESLSPVPLEKRKPIMEALEPLVAGFTPDIFKALYTGFMIENLGKINSDDIPGYMDVLKILVPEPKDANSTLNLLKSFLTQGSVAVAQALVNEAKPLTTCFTEETGHQFIIHYLSSVPLEKRKPIVEALAPLATGFTPDAYSALNTSWMIADLGKINSDDIPGYMNILNNTDYDRGSAEKTCDTLQGVLKK